MKITQKGNNKDEDRIYKATAKGRMREQRGKEIH